MDDDLLYCCRQLCRLIEMIVILLSNCYYPILPEECEREIHISCLCLCFWKESWCCSSIATASVAAYQPFTEFLTSHGQAIIFVTSSFLYLRTNPLCRQVILGIIISKSKTASFTSQRNAMNDNGRSCHTDTYHPIIWVQVPSSPSRDVLDLRSNTSLGCIECR